MCFSTMVESDMKKMERLFGVETDWESFEEAFHLRDKYSLANIPSGIDSSIIRSAETPQQKRLAKMAKEHYAKEIEKVSIKLKKYEQDVIDFETKIKNGSKAKDLNEKLRKRKETVEKQKEKIENCKQISEKGVSRIFPNFYAPVIIQDGKKRLLKLMRYHVCPKNGNELSTFKYNLFNARKDRLLDSQIWKPLFGKQHAIFPFYRFYESVAGENDEAKIIYFEPKDQEIMWSAAIFEEAKIKEGFLRSFAAVTDDPPAEVLAAGHDRCPVFIDKKNFELWLNPKGQSKENLILLLDSVVPTYFEHFAA